MKAKFFAFSLLLLTAGTSLHGMRSSEEDFSMLKAQAILEYVEFWLSRPNQEPLEEECKAIAIIFEQLQKEGFLEIGFFVEFLNQISVHESATLKIREYLSITNGHYADYKEILMGILRLNSRSALVDTRCALALKQMLDLRRKILTEEEIESIEKIGNIPNLTTNITPDTFNGL